MKYIKLPVIVEAFKWVPTDNNVALIRDWMGGFISYNAKMQIEIETLEGVVFASPGDWIIKGVEGEFYPCKPSVFEKTYKKVEDK
jgi:hypothetical protein